MSYLKLVLFVNGNEDRSSLFYFIYLRSIAIANSVIILQYVVIPPRRSTAEAFQILISHMFGDAGSPYLVGVVCIVIIIIKKCNTNV